MTKRQDIQGIRAIAVVMVVAFHAGLPVPGGFTGVDVFFVVSGFVIGRLLLREIEETGRIDLARFSASRVKRLLPALTVMLLATVAAACVLTFGLRTTNILESAIASVLMVSNVLFMFTTGGYFDVGDGEIPLLHTWTLSVEAQFYLAAPFALIGAWWLAARAPLGRRRALLAITLLGAATSLALAAFFVGGGTVPGQSVDPQTLAFYASPTRAWEFLAGTLIAIGEARLIAWRRPAAATALAGIGLGAVLASAFLAGDAGPVPTTGVFLPVFGAALLIAGLTAAGDGPLNRLLGLRPIAYVGDLSYSWYLWHWPLIVYAAISAPERDLGVPAALLSLVPAWLSYRWVETRVRTDRTLVGRRVAMLGAGCVLSILVLGFALTAGQRAAVERAGGVDDLASSLSSRALVESGGCVGETGRAWEPLQGGVGHCLPAAPASAPRLLLVGDSQADAYAYALREIAQQRGMRMDAATGGSCLAAPLSATGEQLASGNPAWCRKLPGEIAASIAADPPALLVVAQSRNNIDIDATAEGRRGTDGERTLLQRRYERALEQLTRPVLEAGGNVLFARAVPNGRSDGSTCGTIVRVLAGELEDCLATKRADAEVGARAFPTWAAVLELTKRQPAMQRFDPSDLFCDATTCSQIRNGQLAYRNSDHLSVDGALAIVPELGAAVDRALAERPGVAEPPTS